MEPSKEESATVNELMQAQVHVFHHVLAQVCSMSLKCAVELGLFDTIHAKSRPLTVSELAASLPSAPTKSPSLQRLLRLLTRMGYFTIQTDPSGSSEDAYSLTANSQVLLKDKPTSLAPFVLAGIDTAYFPAWLQQMGAWFLSDVGVSTPGEMLLGKPIWEFARDNPAFGQSLNAATASDSRLMMKAVVAKCPGAFEGLTSLVDVGGGNGTTATMIAEAFPHVKCTVYDLPHVIATVPENYSLIEVSRGDMFDHVPRADAAFLKQVLHDWSDEKCIKILKRCKEAIPKREDGGKVIIVDIVVDPKDGDALTVETQLLWDMAMLSYAGGKEREIHEWEKIFTAAGFTDYKVTPLGVRSLIELLP